MRLVGQSFLGAALLGAAALSVQPADADGSVNVTCDGSSSVKLTLQGSDATYSCNGNENHVTMDSNYFQVNVTVDNLTLNLVDSSVSEMAFWKGSAATTIPTLNGPLNFQGFSSLQGLLFGNVVFSPDNVDLDIPNTVTKIHFVNSSMTGLDLSQYSNLVTIDLSDTTFTKIPAFLYRHNYTEGVEITVDLSSVSEQTTLTSSELATLNSNAETLSNQSWAKQYNEYCNPVQESTIAEDGSKTLSCNSGSSGRSSNAAAFTSPTGSSPITSTASSSSRSGSADANAGDDDSSGVSTGVLVAIIVVVVLIAVVLAFFILRMYFRRKAANANSNNNDATATLMSKGDATADKGSFISNDEFLRNFRLPQSDVALVKSLGTGRLWMGEYNGGKVVVKRVESEVTDSYVTKALMAQARTFATISHPNITNLVGVTWLAGTDFAVVTEFMDKGNLKTVLANSDVDLDVTTKLQMCCDVALALAYLHETEQNLCAKQLSSRKVLVNRAMSCKLSLFECVPSSAKLGGPTTATTYSYGMGEVAWLPPEVITRSSPMDARKNNIYAFGVLVSEIFTRVTPYQSLVEEMGNTMSDIELVSRVRRQDQLVPHENRRDYLEAPASVRQLVEQCLSYAPMSRPTAKDLVEILHNAKEELATNSI